VSDFSKPEYDSYKQLCRELDLHPSLYPQSLWLPTVSDWLEMLEEASVPVVTIGVFGKGEIREGYVAVATLDKTSDRKIEAPSREEALARLWMAVKNG
jgi:hypothetical protein